jgi:hypothetical protein
MKMPQLPDLNPDDFLCVTEFIVAFYKSLGWNPSTQELDPRRIQINPEIWNYIAGQIIKKWGVKGGLTWMNSGPSTNRYLDKHQVGVLILKGAFIDDKHTLSGTG